MLWLCVFPAMVYKSFSAFATLSTSLSQTSKTVFGSSKQSGKLHPLQPSAVLRIFQNVCRMDTFCAFVPSRALSPSSPAKLAEHVKVGIAP